jgi:hypothetical protein
MKDKIKKMPRFMVKVIGRFTKIPGDEFDENKYIKGLIFVPIAVVAYIVYRLFF